MATLTDLVNASGRAAEIAAHLDELTPQQRVSECLALPGALMASLFAQVRGARSLEIDTFVSPPEKTNVYELKNSLPVFNVSQKRFFRPGRGEVVGYNHTGGLARFTGPGYFFALNGDDGELVFDYTRLPELQPPGWPPIKPNSGLVPGLTYGNMIDYVRGVSAHTVIGAAYRGGKPVRAYFLLTRSAAES